MDSCVRCGLLVAIAAALVVGCTQSDRPEVVPVSGTVTVGGSPVAGVQVTFMTEGAPRAATGTTDAQGKYRLTTFEKDDGAMLGKHTVTIAQGGATGGAGMDADSPDDDAYGEAMGAAASGKPAAAGEEGGIPIKYANPKTSELEREVTKAGPNQFDFDL